MDAQNKIPATSQSSQTVALDKRLDSVGWALFLIMIGCLWLVPRSVVPQGTWLIGTGTIILGLAWIRSKYQITINKFWVAMGVIALAAGFSQFFGVTFPLFPVLMVIVGISILVKPMGKNT